MNWFRYLVMLLRSPTPKSEDAGARPHLVSLPIRKLSGKRRDPDTLRTWWVWCNFKENNPDGTWDELIQNLESQECRLRHRTNDLTARIQYLNTLGRYSK